MKWRIAVHYYSLVRYDIVTGAASSDKSICREAAEDIKFDLKRD